MHTGRKNTLGISIDESGAIEHFIPFLSCTLQERHTPIADSQARGRRDAEGFDSVEGKKWADGTIEVVLDPTTAPYWFALALGSIDSSTPKTHVITQSDDNNPLTAVIKRERNVGTDRIFSNVVVDNLELNFADDVAKITVDVMSKFPTTGDFTATEDEAGVLSYYTFRNATVSIGEDNTIKVRELTLRIENNAEMIFAPGDNDVDSIVWKNFRVTGNFKLLFEDETQKTAFHGLGKQSLTITFEDDDDNMIKITIPRFRVDNWTEDAPIDDIVHEGIDFVAEYDETAQNTISVEIVNQVDEYQTTS